MKVKIELPDVAMFSAKTAGEVTAFGKRYWIERIRKKDIPIVRIGRSVRILRKDLLVFLETRIERTASNTYVPNKSKLNVVGQE